MADWKQDRIEWYSVKIVELLAESQKESCTHDRFNEIAIEISNYQTEINNLKGVR